MDLVGGLIGHQMQLASNAWFVSPVLATEGMKYKSFKTKWGGSRVQRILLTSKDLAQKAKHSLVLSKN